MGKAILISTDLFHLRTEKWVGLHKTTGAPIQLIPTTGRFSPRIPISGPSAATDSGCSTIPPRLTEERPPTESGDNCGTSGFDAAHGRPLGHPWKNCGLTVRWGRWSRQARVGRGRPSTTSSTTHSLLLPITLATALALQKKNLHLWSVKKKANERKKGFTEAQKYQNIQLLLDICVS